MRIIMFYIEAGDWLHVRLGFKHYIPTFSPFAFVLNSFFLLFTLNHLYVLTPLLPSWPKSFFGLSILFISFLVSSLHPSGFSLSSPLFNETVFSYAVIPWPQSFQSYLSFMEFELTFRPSLPDGTLLYSDDAGSGDFLAINLVDGYVEFRFDCGSGGATIRYYIDVFLNCSLSALLSQYIFKLDDWNCVCYRSDEQISLDKWHELRVSRTAKSGILQVDSQRPIEGIAEVFCFWVEESCSMSFFYYKRAGQTHTLWKVCLYTITVGYAGMGK